MIDFSTLKSLKIPEGVVTKIVSAGVTLWEAVKYKNWIPYSTTEDGKTIFNGVGYKDNSRLNSSAVVVDQTGYAAFGFIPLKAGDVVRVKGLTWNSTYNTGCYFWIFDSSFTKLKQKRPNGGSSDITVEDEGNGVTKFTIRTYATETAYFRISAYGSGANAIITVNEEIK